MTEQNAPVSNLDAAVDRMLAAMAGLPDLPGYARQGKAWAAHLSAAVDGSDDDRAVLAAHGAVIASTADVAVEIHRLNQMKKGA